MVEPVHDDRHSPGVQQERSGRLAARHLDPRRELDVGVFRLPRRSEFHAAENSLFLYKFAQMGDFLYAQRPRRRPISARTDDHRSARDCSYLGEMFPEIRQRGHVGQRPREPALQVHGRADLSPTDRTSSRARATPTTSPTICSMRGSSTRSTARRWPKKYRDQALQHRRFVLAIPLAQRHAPRDRRHLSQQTAAACLTRRTSSRARRAGRRSRRACAMCSRWASNAVTPYLTEPPFQAVDLVSRGDAYAMTDSGNYIMRSGDDANARQIIFDAGPKGGSHGHYDLLNFELSGYGRPLISDPGAYQYDTSANRAYVISTQAHNTHQRRWHRTSPTSKAPAIPTSTSRNGRPAPTPRRSPRPTTATSYLAGSPVRHAKHVV